MCDTPAVGRAARCLGGRSRASVGWVHVRAMRRCPGRCPPTAPAAAKFGHGHWPKCRRGRRSQGITWIFLAAKLTDTTAWTRAPALANGRANRMETPVLAQQGEPSRRLRPRGRWPDTRPCRCGALGTSELKNKGRPLCGRLTKSTHSTKTLRARRRFWPMRLKSGDCSVPWQGSNSTPLPMSRIIAGGSTRLTVPPHLRDPRETGRRHGLSSPPHRSRKTTCLAVWAPMRPKRVGRTAPSRQELTRARRTCSITHSSA